MDEEKQMFRIYNTNQINGKQKNTNGIREGTVNRNTSKDFIITQTFRITSAKTLAFMWKIAAVLSTFPIKISILNAAYNILGFTIFLSTFSIF